MNKNNIATQGILLGGMAAIYDDALQILTDPQEQQWARERLLDNPSGAEIKGSPVMAVAGGMLFYFNNTDNVQTYNEQLATLEQQAGPNNSSQLLFLQSSEVQGGQVVDELEGGDLPDDPGASTSKVDLENKLNGDVSECIQDYSSAISKYLFPLSTSFLSLINSSP